MKGEEGGDCMSEWGIPEAIKHLDRVYEGLEQIRKNLCRFVSYDDDERQDLEGDSLLSNLTRVIYKIEDTTDNIGKQVNSLLKEESK